jgi:hypothetical protein
MTLIFSRGLRHKRFPDLALRDALVSESLRYGRQFLGQTTASAGAVALGDLPHCFHHATPNPPGKSSFTPASNSA